MPQQPSPPPGVASTISEMESLSFSIIRPIFPYATVAGNSYHRSKEFDAENFYNILIFSNQLELWDSMGLIHLYSLEPFMTLCRFFYMRVVIDFY